MPRIYTADPNIQSDQFLRGLESGTAARQTRQRLEQESQYQADRLAQYDAQLAMAQERLNQEQIEIQKREASDQASAQLAAMMLEMDPHERVRKAASGEEPLFSEQEMREIAQLDEAGRAQRMPELMALKQLQREYSTAVEYMGMFGELAAAEGIGQNDQADLENITMMAQDAMAAGDYGAVREIYQQARVMQNQAIKRRKYSEAATVIAQVRGELSWPGSSSSATAYRALLEEDAKFLERLFDIAMDPELRRNVDPAALMQAAAPFSEEFHKALTAAGVHPGMIPGIRRAVGQKVLIDAGVAGTLAMPFGGVGDPDQFQTPPQQAPGDFRGPFMPGQDPQSRAEAMFALPPEGPPPRKESPKIEKLKEDARKAKEEGDEAGYSRAWDEIERAREGDLPRARHKKGVSLLDLWGRAVDVLPHAQGPGRPTRGSTGNPRNRPGNPRNRRR